MTILQKRLERAVEGLNTHQIDAWIACGRETNILGEPALLFLMPAEVMGRTALILTAQGEKICVCPGIEAEENQASGLFTQVAVYPGGGYETCIAQALAARMPMGRIAIDVSTWDPASDGLSHSDYLMLQRCLEQAGFAGELVSSEPLMKLVRGKKSDEEAEKIAFAVSEAMEIYEQARPGMKMGMSGRDVQALFQTLIRARGYGFSWFEPGNPYVSVGARSSYNCKRPPADVFIQPGDLINVDLGLRVDGFASDNQRSFYALREGEKCPPQEVVRAWQTIQHMNRDVCAAMKTGVDSNDLTAIGDRLMKEHGYDGWAGGYGHELCLFAHNGGIGAGKNAAKAGLDTILEENMTFTLEPAILTSCGRLCQEEVVRVTAQGGVMLSTPQSEIWLIRE